MRTIFAGALLCLLTIHVANKPRHHHRTSLQKMQISPGLHRIMADGAGRVVAHPRGCPSRAFCGCGAAVRISVGQSALYGWRRTGFNFRALHQRREELR
jgi:hypothetical protein